MKMKKEVWLQFFDVLEQPTGLVYNDLMVAIEYEFGILLQKDDLLYFWEGKTDEYKPAYWLAIDENKDVDYKKVSGHCYKVVKRSWDNITNEKEEKILLVLEMNWVQDLEA
jgi:hypothetical protein